MTAAEAIVEAVRSNESEMSTSGVKEAVCQGPDGFAETTVDDKLGDLVRSGDLIRIRQGWYDVPARVRGDEARPETERPAPPNGEAGGKTQDVEAMKMDMTTGGGAGGAVIQERPIAQYTVDYVPLGKLRGRQPKDAFTTRMIGNSMSPELQPNARIVVEPYPEGSQRIETDGMYVFRLDGEVQVKQLEWKPRKRLLCKPTNEKYERFELDLSDDGPIAQGDIDFAIIGRVWGHFCLL